MARTDTPPGLAVAAIGRFDVTAGRLVTTIVNLTADQATRASAAAGGKGVDISVGLGGILLNVTIG